MAVAGFVVSQVRKSGPFDGLRAGFGALKVYSRARVQARLSFF